MKKDDLSIIFRIALIAAAAIGVAAIYCAPYEPEPTLKGENFVSLTSLSGDKMSCALPGSNGKIACFLPNGEKAICSEIDATGVFSNCAQPWKWEWLDNVNSSQAFAADRATIIAYEGTHPFIPRSAF